MTIVSSTKDTADLTLNTVAEFDASPERVWQVWEDPRRFERWWGLETGNGFAVITVDAESAGSRPR